MQFERDLHVEVTRLAVDLAPEFLGDGPLIVEYVEGAGAPGVHDPVRPSAAWLSGRQARHRHDAVLAKTIRKPDAAAYILGVLRTDRRIGMQRVAVAVQACNLHAGALEQSEEIISRRVGGEDVVEGGNVHRRQEAAGVQLDTGEAELADHLDRVR